MIQDKKDKKDKDTENYENTKYDEIKFTNKRILISQSTKKDKDTNNYDNYENTKYDEIIFTNRRILISESPKKEVKTRKPPNYNILLYAEDSDKSTVSFIKKAWDSLNNYVFPEANNYIIKKKHPGHFVNFGCDAGILKNPYWLVYDKRLKEEYYMMFCEPDKYTKFSKKDYQNIINPEENIYPSWHFHEATGYISTRTYPNNDNNYYYLHQLICQKHQDKKFKTQSVDHINRDKLDNRNENLRFLTQSQQNQNTIKRERKYNAQNLPEGINQKDMPKYVGYKSEKYGPNKIHFRFGFVIEKHPYQNILKSKNIKDENFPIRWYTTKSMKVSSTEKIQEARDKRKAYDEQFKLKFKNEYDEWKKISNEELN
jgi:hypothetical protein